MADYQDIATDFDPSEISDKANIKQLTVKNQKTGKESSLGGGLIDFRYYESILSNFITAKLLIGDAGN